MMMNRSAAILSGVLLCGAAGAYAQTPYVLGVWELNVKESRLPPQFPAVSETRRYTLREDGYLVVLAIRVDRDGHPDFIQVAAKSDGKDYPQYQSGPLADFQIGAATTPFTYSETVIDDHAIEAVARWKGQVTNRGTRRISDDGTRMTMDLKAVTPDGKEIPFVLVFDRKGD